MSDTVSFQPVIQNILGGILVIMALVAHAFAMARWVLSRECAHISDDNAKHTAIDEKLDRLKDGQADLSGDVKELTARVNMAPDRDFVDTMFNRLEDKLTKQGDQMEQRFNERFQRVNSAQEVRVTSIIEKLTDVIKIVEKK